MQGASFAPGEPGSVEEDAPPVDDACLALPVTGLDRRTLALRDVEELPVLRVEALGPLQHALLVVLVGEVRPLGAAAAVRGGGVDALASPPEDAGPAGGQPGEVDAVAAVLLAGVIELDPGAGEVKGNLGHAPTLACVGGSSDACHRASE